LEFQLFSVSAFQRFSVSRAKLGGADMLTSEMLTSEKLKC